ncbi:potassium channel family protein [Corynebacterium sp. A21]|uniref:potassium channel family protein n=1 Tax=Corynebacterium sp. A21 TaxID=3457318 RepID=UPI003FD24464
MAKFPGPFSRNRHRIDIPPVLVIGLGRFGSSLARELANHGVEVLGVDCEEKLVREHSAELMDSAVADTTDPEALRQLGVEEFERVVVAIGENLEASILTTSNLVELGIQDIWAKADTDPQARILTRVGAHHVVRPNRDTGRRVAHLLGGRIRDFAPVDENYGVITLAPPAVLLSAPLNLNQVWRDHRVQVISVHVGKNSWEPVATGHQLTATDFIAVAGSPDDLEAFAGR